MAPDRFRNQVALMRHEDPLGINRRHDCRREMSGSGDALHGPIQAPSEAICQTAVPGATGEHEQWPVFGGRGGGHQLRIIPRAIEVNLNIE